MRSRTTFALLLTAGALSASSLPAFAADPAGGCPTGWDLFQIPSEGFPTAHAIDAQGNDDGFVCRKAFNSTEHPGSLFNIIDNRVQSG